MALKIDSVPLVFMNMWMMRTSLEKRDFKSTLKTVFTVKLVISRILHRTSIGLYLKVEEDPNTFGLRLIITVWIHFDNKKNPVSTLNLSMMTLFHAWLLGKKLPFFFLLQYIILSLSFFPATMRLSCSICLEQAEEDAVLVALTVCGHVFDAEW